MKASFAAITLALAGTAFAAPAADVEGKAARYPYSINSISLRHLTKDNSYVFISNVAWYKESGEARESTTCTTHWNPSVPPQSPVPCADPAFSFWFPSGVKSLEDYEVAIKGPDGQGSVNIAAGPKYNCGKYNGTIDGIDFECKITNGGKFYVPVA
ncbi:hypothetical protein N7492_006204 [Penicillium capsulatum]|uniref:AA1-like domain-containing protein n=1 Tax=Penicillium capsulatum TaxID=69766 RepID=A0A9W9LMR8_9EURO|nr:hypothetical protein N7492_006204 [Penicillium capsulatum]KAJ6108857.1 hypothetical protein N7512_008694 [Penicillium capsulatum]